MGPPRRRSRAAPRLSPRPSALAAPSRDEPEADQGGGEQEVEPALVADGQPAEAGERALDHPAVAAQALGALDSAAGNPGRNAPPPRGPAALVVIVPFVGVQLGEPLPRPASAVPDRRHGVEQRQRSTSSRFFAACIRSPGFASCKPLATPAEYPAARSHLIAFAPQPVAYLDLKLQNWFASKLLNLITRSMAKPCM